MQRYPKIPVIVNTDYKVDIEPYAGVLWVHNDFYKFTITSLKQFCKDWEDFCNTIRSDLYVLHNAETDKPSKRYIEKFGFKYLKSLDNKKPYEIWKRSK